MNSYDKELIKNSPSMLKGIAVQAAQLNGNTNTSMSLNDVCGMARFGMALGGQISEADKTSTGKVIAEAAIGGLLFGCFIGLLAGNIANRIQEKREQSESFHRTEYEKTKAFIDELNRLYFPR